MGVRNNVVGRHGACFAAVVQANLVGLAVTDKFQTNPSTFVTEYEMESGTSGVTVELVGSNVDTPDERDPGLSTATIVIIAACAAVFLVVVALAVRHFCCQRQAQFTSVGGGHNAQEFFPETELTSYAKHQQLQSPIAGSGGVVAHMNPVADHSPLVGDDTTQRATRRKGGKSSRARPVRTASSRRV